MPSTPAIPRPQKRLIPLAVVAVFLVALTACETMVVVPPALTPEERAVLAMGIKGLKIGATQDVLGNFSQVKQIQSGIPGMRAFEIYNPSPQISMAVAFFHEGHLRRLESRYFRGNGIVTLSRAGSWEGIRSYLIEKIGPPSRVGILVPLETRQRGLDVRYAKFNGEWLFTRINRKVHYVAMSDDRGGVGVVTLIDTTPIAPPPEPSPTPRPKRPAAVVAPTPASSPANTIASPTPAPKPTIAPTPVPTPKPTPTPPDAGLFSAETVPTPTPTP